MQMHIFDQIQIILVETSHSGNLGSAARAMKTMGLTHLRLVSPKQPIDEQAEALSAGAKDVLDNAQIYTSFDEAVADCQLLIGTSARLRHLQSTLIDPRACGEKVVQHVIQHAMQVMQAVDSAQSFAKIGLVFGRERVGLTNEELLKCHYHLYIPTNPEYGSLNLAMAVQLACYEIRMAYLAQQELARQENGLLQKNRENQPLETAEFPTQQAMNHFFDHTERLYKQLGFIRNEAVMPKLRRLYQRARIEANELNLLRGMLTAVEKSMER